MHQLRTTIRRLEAVLDTLPDDDYSKLRKQLRALRRRAGRVRDVDVQIALLKSLRVDSHLDQKEAVAHKLTAKRNKREKKLVGAIDDDSVRAIRRRLSKLARDLRELPVEEQPPQLHDPLGAALDQFSELATRIESLDADSLHDFRTECKRIRYLAEIAGDEPDGELVVRELKRIQDAVGAWHDWSDLLAFAHDVLADTPHPMLIGLLRSTVAGQLAQAQRTISEVRDSLHAVRAARRKRGPRSTRSAGPPGKARAFAAGL